MFCPLCGIFTWCSTDTILNVHDETDWRTLDSCVTVLFRQVLYRLRPLHPIKTQPTCCQLFPSVFTHNHLCCPALWGERTYLRASWSHLDRNALWSLVWCHWPGFSLLVAVLCFVPFDSFVWLSALIFLELFTLLLTSWSIVSLTASQPLLSDGLFCCLKHMIGGQVYIIRGESVSSADQLRLLATIQTISVGHFITHTLSLSISLSFSHSLFVSISSSHYSLYQWA